MGTSPAGVNARTLRFGSGNTWVLANQGDEFDALIGLVFRSDDEFFLPGSVITGLDGIQPGRIYYLATDGFLTTSVPTSGYVVVIGKGVGDGILLFAPQLPVSPSVFNALRDGSGTIEVADAN